MLAWLSGIVVGGLLFTLLHGIAAVVMPVPLPAMPAGVLWWALASNALIAAVLTAIAIRSPWSGGRLTAGVFLVLYVVFHFTSLIEAAFFGLFFDGRSVIVLLARTLIVSLIFAPLLVALVGKMRERPAPAGAAPRLTRPLARFAGSSALYLALYFAFGLAVYPFIQDFYAKLAMPGPLAIIAMQLLVRGPIFAATILLVVRLVRGTTATNALMAALVMSVIGGVAPLMVPNPFFPDAVRYAHFFEVTIENFIFGAVVGWLMSPSRPETTRLATAA